MRAAAGHAPHTGLVMYTLCAGLAMIALGVLRLRLPTAADAPYPAGNVRATYSIMIAVGLLLIALAVRWRFFA